jgi:hypothetical protein
LSFHVLCAFTGSMAHCAAQRERRCQEHATPTSKVYPLAPVGKKVQVNGWQLAGVVALSVVIGAVLFLIGLRT